MSTLNASDRGNEAPGATPTAVVTVCHHCTVCGRYLKNPKYRALGIGPVCLKKQMKRERERELNEKAKNETDDAPTGTSRST